MGDYMDALKMFMRLSSLQTILDNAEKEFGIKSITRHPSTGKILTVALTEAAFYNYFSNEFYDTEKKGLYEIKSIEILGIHFFTCISVKENEDF